MTTKRCPAVRTLIFPQCQQKAVLQRILCGMPVEERQALMERISEAVQDYFDAYDWDAKFIERFGD